MEETQVMDPHGATAEICEKIVALLFGLSLLGHTGNLIRSLTLILFHTLPSTTEYIHLISHHNQDTC